MNNHEAIEVLKSIFQANPQYYANKRINEAFKKACEALEQSEWIPIKYRPMTGEERIAFAKYYGIEYCDTANEKIFDCLMPEDGQEILISTSWGIRIDVAANDTDGDGFISYGLEENGDWDGITAWMPSLKPYKEAEE